MKRYLIKIFEKMQDSNGRGSGGGSLLLHNTTATTSG